MDYLKKNYHTHTPRCGHAIGTEREYIESDKEIKALLILCKQILFLAWQSATERHRYVGMQYVFM